MGAPTDGRDGEPTREPTGAPTPDASAASAATAKGRLRLVPDGEASGSPSSATGAPFPMGALGEEDDGGAASEDFYHYGEDAPPPSADGPSAAEEIAAARLALAEMVLSDPYAWGVYERQVGQGLVGMATRAAELRRLLEERGEEHVQGAVEVAVPELALRTHPASPAAAWERLHSPERVCREYAVNERDGAVAAVVDAASKDEALFRTLTHVALDEDGPREAELLGAAREAHAALRARGLRFPPRRFSDHVWRACREVFPDAPGVRWDEVWADGLLRRALRRISEAGASGDTCAPDPARAEAVEGEVGEALASRDRRRYRRAVTALVACRVPGSSSASGGTHKDAPLSAYPGGGSSPSFGDLVTLAREARERAPSEATDGGGK